MFLKRRLRGKLLGFCLVSCKGALGDIAPDIYIISHIIPNLHLNTDDKTTPIS